VADGYELDTVQFPHDKQSLYIHNIDERVIDEAAKCIRDHAPDLSWIYLEYTDDIGHRYGTSKEQDEAVAYLDRQIERIWTAIEFRKKNYPEDWGIIITTDHGRDAKSGRGHGGQSDRERTTWMVSNLPNLNSYFYDDNPGIVDIMPTIARYFQLKIPTQRQMEIDGLALTGKISVSDFHANYFNDSISLDWKTWDKQGNLKIWLSTSNYFKEGGMDNYILITEVPTSRGHYQFSTKNNPSTFYKIVLEAPDNFTNRWIILSIKK